MIPIEREELAIRKWPLYFAAAVFVFFLYILYEEEKLSDTISIAAGIGLCIFIVVYYMLSKNKLVIDNDGITQELFFGKKREIKWTELKASQLNWNFHGHGGHLEWTIMPYFGKSITLQAGFYNRKIMRSIAEAIVIKCPTAIIDKRIRNIADGKFPWYIF